jgi:hypothetical protein
MEPIIVYYAKALMPTVKDCHITDYLTYVDAMQEYQKSNRFYTETHHIIPRFLCKEHAFLLRIKENQKVLSVGDHILVHKKLMEIFPCLQTKTAYLMVLRTCKNLGIAITEDARSEEILTREWLRENTPWKQGPSPEQKEKSRLAHLGKHIGKGSRLYHKNDVEIRVPTEKEWNRLEQEGWVRGRSPRIKKLAADASTAACKKLKGTVLIQEDGNKCRVLLTEKEKYKQEGWVPVNTYKISRKGIMTYVTNGVITKMINKQEVQDYINKGWRQGLTRKNTILKSCSLLFQ